MKELKTLKLEENHYQIDMRGWMCPYPKYAVTTILSKLPACSTLDLLVDCPAATKDVPALAREKGYTIEKIEPLNEGEWRIAISNLC